MIVVCVVDNLFDLGEEKLKETCIVLGCTGEQEFLGAFMHEELQVNTPMGVI